MRVRHVTGNALMVPDRNTAIVRKVAVKVDLAVVRKVVARVVTGIVRKVAVKVDSAIVRKVVVKVDLVIVPAVALVEDPVVLVIVRREADLPHVPAEVRPVVVRVVLQVVPQAVPAVVMFPRNPSRQRMTNVNNGTDFSRQIQSVKKIKKTIIRRKTAKALSAAAEESNLQSA